MDSLCRSAPEQEDNESTSYSTIYCSITRTYFVFYMEYTAFCLLHHVSTRPGLHFFNHGRDAEEMTKDLQWKVYTRTIDIRSWSIIPRTGREQHRFDMEVIPSLHCNSSPQFLPEANLWNA